MISVRWMINRDLDEVVKIEKKNSGIWTKDDFLASLRQQNCVGLVAIIDDTIAGFCLYLLEDDCYEIANISVHPKYILFGIGEEFIDKMKTKMSQSKRNFLAINVHETNLFMQLFLKDLGFKAVDVIRNYYGTEDAYRFIYNKVTNAKVRQSQL